MPSEAHPNINLTALHSAFLFPHHVYTCCCCFVIVLLASCHPHTTTAAGLDLALPATPIKGCPTASFIPNLAPSKEAADLKVLVPNITSLRQFVNCSDPANVRGFCIDVFQMALSILTPASPALSPNMSIHYTCFNFSASPGGPTYDDMVELVANGTYDALVGDVTIAAHRISVVDFSQKYMESGIVIVSKMVSSDVSPWLFFGWPFSLRLWCTIVGAFVFTSLLVCYFERDNHPEFTEGHFTQRLASAIGFSMEKLVLLERESLKNTTSQGIMLAWLLFVILLSASYTAGLSSFLTTNNLSPSSQDILSLRESGEKIGYRRGSVVKDYLTQRFQLPEDNLVPLRMVQEFINNLTNGPKNGGVIAVVDELPYANIILSYLADSTCDFGIVGQELTQEGFGFGFNKDNNFEHLFSIALMNLTESGCLQNLQNREGMVGTSNCSITSPSNQIPWKSSSLLFIILIGFLILCVFANYGKLYFCAHHSHKRTDPQTVDDSIVGEHSTTRTNPMQYELELQSFS